MTVAVKGKVPTKWDDQTSRHLTDRLQALERALAGGAQVFVAPAIPSFGPGAGGGGGGGGGTTVVTGATDHGALTGLGDDDHPQYVQHGERVVFPHQHSNVDLVGLEHSFLPRGVASPPTPHNHLAKDVTDLRPDDEQYVLAHRMFGG